MLVRFVVLAAVIARLELDAVLAVLAVLARLAGLELAAVLVRLVPNAMLAVLVEKCRRARSRRVVSLQTKFSTSFARSSPGRNQQVCST